MFAVEEIQNASLPMDEEDSDISHVLDEFIEKSNIENDNSITKTFSSSTSSTSTNQKDVGENAIEKSASISNTEKIQPNISIMSTINNNINNNNINNNNNNNHLLDTNQTIGFSNLPLFPKSEPISTISKEELDVVEKSSDDASQSTIIVLNLNEIEKAKQQEHDNDSENAVEKKRKFEVMLLEGGEGFCTVRFCC